MLHRHSLHKQGKRFLAIAAASAVTLLMRQNSARADFTWAAGTGNWSTTGDWTSTQNPGTYPQTGDTSDNLTFTGAGGTVTDDLLSSASSLTFAGNNAYTVQGTTGFLTLSLNGGGITNNSTASQTIKTLLEILPSTSAVFTANGSGNLNFSSTNSTATGSISIDSGATLTFANSSTGIVSIAGSLVMGSGSTLVNNSGSAANFTGNGSSTTTPLSLLGGNLISISSGSLSVGHLISESGTGSTISLSGGKLIVGGNGVSLGGDDTVHVGSGATLSFSGGSINFGSTGSVPTNFSTSTLSVDSGGVLTTSNPTTAVDARVGSLLDSGTVNSFRQLTIGGGQLSVAGTGLLSITGGAWSLTGGASLISSGTINAASPAVMSGGSVTLSGGTFTGNGVGGTVSSFSVTDGSINFTNGSTPVIAGNAAALIVGGTFAATTGAQMFNSGASAISLGDGTHSVTFIDTPSSGDTLTNHVIFPVSSAAPVTLELVSSSSSKTVTVTGALTGGDANAYFIVANSNNGSAKDNSASNAFGGTLEIQTGTFSLGAVSNLLTTPPQIIVGDTVADASGTLDISGATNSALIAISTGQVLSGHGTVTTGTNTLIINSAGTLKPGGTPGVLTLTGNLSVAGGSNLLYDLSGGSSDATMVPVSGNLAFGGTSSAQVNLSLTSVTLPPLNTNVTYELLSYGTYTGDGAGSDSDISGDFSVTGLNPATQSWQVLETSASTDQIDLVITSVPEPGSLSLLAIGGIGLLSRRRKDRKAKETAEPLPA